MNKEKYFELMARGLEGPMSEGPVSSFATREAAETALADSRRNEFKVRYWIEERDVEICPVVYIVTVQCKTGEWRGCLSETQSKTPSLLAARHATKEDAVAAMRKRAENMTAMRFERIEVV